MDYAHLTHHVVKRGMEHAHKHFASAASPETIARLQLDAELYEQSGVKELMPLDFLPVAITAFLALLIIASIRYTIGDVMASLAMIETPSTAIIEPASSKTYSDDAPPAYSDEEKEPLTAAKADVDADTDVEITVINHKPITGKITTTIGHLHRIGGFRARWRGLGLSILYHSLHAFGANGVSAFLGFGLVGHVFAYTLTSLSMARLHMGWTHAMITTPSSRRFWKRSVARKELRSLFLPALVFALAQQATFILPIGVAFALGAGNVNFSVPVGEQPEGVAAKHHGGCGNMLMGLRFLAVPATAIFIGLAVLLPAAVTLTRIEAILLAEGEETIVPFDKEAIIGDIDMSARGSSRKLFVQAWRSFDRSARLRLIKIYAKMVLAQFTIAIVAVHLAVAEMFLLGGERVGVFFKSATAQLQLMAIEQQQQAGAQ